ncbi:MAG: DMT family transporter [Oscillospiraceae bacterium]|nr:DMT family transporter [Oscillospiraceae bacterium]
MKNHTVAGHLLCLFTIAVWGTTFISTKILLVHFEPVEILFIRFLLGLLALFLARPKLLRGTTFRQELTFAGAGLCGICLYYLLENIALTYTLASNVSIIVSVAPFFTAILCRLFLKEESLHASFFIGFVVAIAGICLMNFNGGGWQFNPIGDLLSLLAAFVWGIYSVLIKKISTYGYHTVLVTRRIFFYGTLFMIPPLFLFGFRLDLSRFVDPISLGNLLYLGFIASALCFATWNLAVNYLGPIKTSAYIYLTPVVTIVMSALILHEPITIFTILGALLTLAGLFLSESRSLRKACKKPQKFHRKQRHPMIK